MEHLLRTVWNAPAAAHHAGQHALPGHLYRALLERLPFVTFLASLDGRLNQIYVSPQIETLLGYTQDEWVGNPALWYECLHPADRDRWNAELSRFLVVGEPFSSEYRFVTRNGDTVWVRGEARLIRDDAGRPVYLQGVGYDVTEQMRAEQRLRDALAEKETLLKEVHHRVKNNLAVVSSLFYLQSTYVQDEATIRILRESEDRVRSMALVHEALYRSDDIAALDFAEYATALAEQLLRAYARPDQHVRLTTSMTATIMKLDQSVPCGLILNELIANALKHAFPPGHDGEIRLALDRASDGGVVLSVRDTGVGLAPDFDTTSTATLGLRLIRALTRQLDGQFDLTPAETGVEARLLLPRLTDV